MQIVEIRKEPVELYKVLKFAGLASSGGQAKEIIELGYVYVNGEVESRKRRKLYIGDEIEFEEEKLVLALEG